MISIVKVWAIIMGNFRIQKILRFLTIICYILIFVSVVTSPHFEAAQPNPYFQFNNMPMAYWIGVLTSIAASLLSIFSQREDSNQALGLSALFSLVLFTNVIPKLMYRNQIWLDTYPYVCEVVHILNTNHIGSGHALETPALGLFTSQLSLFTGLNYIVIVEFIPLLIPSILFLFVYLLAKLIVGRRAAVIAVLVYIAINSFGLWFMRDDLALIIQLVTLYSFTKLMMSPARSWYVIMLLSYGSLTLCHPGASLSTLVVMISPLILMWARPVIFKLIKKNHQDSVSVFFGKKKLFQLILVPALIWSSWYSIIQHLGFITGRLYLIWKVLPEGPASMMSSSGYTPVYYNIVTLTFYELVIGTVIGSILILYYIFMRKFDWKLEMLSSWFISAMFSIAVLFLIQLTQYTGGFFLCSFPALGMLVGYFVVELDHKSVKRILAVTAKAALLTAILFFILILPLTMYANMAFVYPPTSTLQFDDFLTKRASGSVGVIGGHEDVTSYAVINDAKAGFSIGIFSTNTSIMPYNIIAITYRAYAKDAYNRFQPSMTQSLDELEKRLTTDQTFGFARIYVSDKWHAIYTK